MSESSKSSGFSEMTDFCASPTSKPIDPFLLQLIDQTIDEYISIQHTVVWTPDIFDSIRDEFSPVVSDIRVGSVSSKRDPVMAMLRIQFPEISARIIGNG